MWADDDQRSAVVGQTLRDLLTTVPRHRRRWASRAKKTSGDINQSAIARTIEEYLWDSGERSESEINLARTLKDRVSRALRGQLVSMETLRWFIGAFDFDQVEEEEILMAYSESLESCDTYLANSITIQRDLVRPQHHRTISLFERYRVVDGRLESRNTRQVIRAIRGEVSKYMFNHELSAERVDVIHGGSLGREYEYGGGLRAVEIDLDRKLLPLQSVSLDYCTYFGELGNSGSEVRRLVYGRAQNVDLAVEFQGIHPTRAWWCAWGDQLAGDPARMVPIEVVNGSLHRYFSYVEQSVVGFLWEW